VITPKPCIRTTPHAAHSGSGYRPCVGAPPMVRATSVVAWRCPLGDDYRISTWDFEGAPWSALDGLRLGDPHGHALLSRPMAENVNRLIDEHRAEYHPGGSR
jgi:hypothetical protein